MEDWLSDPLTIPDASRQSWTYRKPRADVFPEASWEKWRSFHFATRLKLEGAVYFCTQLLGASTLPNDVGLPLLTHRLREWSASAFFFELYSAYDTLLQEINVVYGCGLALNDVTWHSLNDKLPKGLHSLMTPTRNEGWFKQVVWFRNTASHHYVVPMEEAAWGRGEQTWGLEVDEVRLVYFDEPANELKRENVAVCKQYLNKMLSHVYVVWDRMTQKFA